MEISIYNYQYNNLNYEDLLKGRTNITTLWYLHDLFALVLKYRKFEIDSLINAISNDAFYSDQNFVPSKLCA